ncbi:hypothetical protein QQF64_016820 [Cirrhinus molitorella]|uniref:Uncharacterized protein n=1 Tax=Cirrhinus molitorella TaxID=172907 RepID=A0ABR3LRD5_9TELE
MELWGDGDAGEAEHPPAAPPDGEVSAVLVLEQAQVRDELLEAGSCHLRIVSAASPHRERASAGLFPETPDAADWMSQLNRETRSLTHLGCHLVLDSTPRDWRLLSDVMLWSEHAARLNPFTQLSVCSRGNFGIHRL